jgi:hypothetical protein
MYDGSGLTRSTATDLASNAGGAAGCWLVLMAAWSFDLRSTCDFSALGLLRLWRHHPAAPVRLRVRVGVAPRSRAIFWRPRAKPRGKGRGECMDRGDVSCTAHRVSTYERRVAFHPGANGWLSRDGLPQRARTLLSRSISSMPGFCRVTLNNPTSRARPLACTAQHGGVRGIETSSGSLEPCAV